MNRSRTCLWCLLRKDVLRFSNLLELKLNGRLLVKPFPSRFKVPVSQKHTVRHKCAHHVQTHMATNTHEVESIDPVLLKYSQSNYRYCWQLSSDLLTRNNKIEVRGEKKTFDTHTFCTRTNAFQQSKFTRKHSNRTNVRQVQKCWKVQPKRVR